MSQLDGESQEIDGVKYTVYMMAPSVAMDMLVDIGKVVGPALGTLADAEGNILEAQVDGKFFGNAAAQLFANLSKPVLRDVVKQLGAVSEADGVRLDRIHEAHFKGKLGSMLKWMGFALKVQYGNFFSALGDASGLVRAGAEQA